MKELRVSHDRIPGRSRAAVGDFGIFMMPAGMGGRMARSWHEAVDGW